MKVSEMTRVELQTLLDSHGADPARWPAALRVAALNLIAEDAKARAAHEAAMQFDTVLTGYAALKPADETAAARVLTRIAAPLPRQDRAWWHWPTVLLDWQFAPAWPRMAERAGATAATSTDITAAVFEPEPITGAQP
jgi:hypothetical protein